MQSAASAQPSFEELLHPYATGRLAFLQKRQRRLAHYTTADVAFSILSTKRIWMRNAGTMNDFSEIQHGRQCLEVAYRSGLGDRMMALVDSVHPNTSVEALKLFDGWFPSLRFNTFMTCVSEHLGPEAGPDEDEDRFGRLSMWRASGGENGVALVVNPGFLGNPDVMNLNTSPVLYADEEGFRREFERVVLNLEQHRDVIAVLSPELLAGAIFNIMRHAVICTKHPGFWEEREWRVVYTPNMGVSRYVEEAVETVNGVPQTVQKLILEDNAAAGVVGLDPTTLLDRVIIGPTNYRMTLQQTFHGALAKLGFPDPNARIGHAEIPIRR